MNTMRLVLLFAVICTCFAMDQEFPKGFNLTGSRIHHRVPRAPLSATAHSPPPSRRPNWRRGSARASRLRMRSRYRNVTASAAALSDRLFGSTVYDPVARPISDDSKAVDVNFRFLLTGIRSLNPITHTLTATALMCSFWKEQRVRWAKRYYGNITAIRATPGMIWMPDIQGISSRSMEVQTRSSSALIDHRGNVSHCVFGELRSLCRLDLASFPYDEHICRFILRPHGLSARLVNMIMDNATDNSIIHFGEWEVHTMKVFTHFNNFGPIELGTGVFELRLRRTSDHYRWSVCIPTASLLLVVVVSSWLPRRHLRARQGLLSGLLLANVLLLRHTADLLEGAERLPNILLLQSFCLGLVTSNIISASILQALPLPTNDGTVKGGNTFERFMPHVRVAVSKLDVFGYPAIGVLLILWTSFIA